MNRGTNTLAAACVLALCGVPGALANPPSPAVPVRICADAEGDAVIRRTDPGAIGPLAPGAELPDLVSVRLSGWSLSGGTNDPYAGVEVRPADAHLFKLQLTFAGLVNPPGPLGLNATTANPFQFGPSPLYGYLELDIDQDIDTGGELGPAAHGRYLGNVARFGGLPRGTLGTRAAKSGFSLDTNFNTTPQVERSGADFVLSLCGCVNPTLVSRSPADNDSVFGPGETWVIRGRFFVRSGGYQNASSITGGSAGGLYDPFVNLRFSHSTASNTTAVTLIYPLDMTGAAQLSTQPQQNADFSAANHTSIEEGVLDLIDAAQGGNGPIFGPAHTLTHRWANRTAASVLDPTQWRCTALFGTTYGASTGGPVGSGGALFVWTDAGFDYAFGDVDGDGTARSASDRAAVQNFISSADGTIDDADQTVNGSVLLPAFGVNFSVFDLDYDGVVGPDDVWLSLVVQPACPSDVNGSGWVDADDIFAFLTAWFEAAFGTCNPMISQTDPACVADADRSGTVTSDDIFVFLNGWFETLGACP